MLVTGESRVPVREAQGHDMPEASCLSEVCCKGLCGRDV